MQNRSSLFVGFGLVSALFFSGCGNDCQSTCTKLYGSAPNCGEPNETLGTKGLNAYGESRTQKERQCMTACEKGLSVPGEVGDYDPEDLNTPADVELETDRQVAVWMDCVDVNNCMNLEAGYCRPVW